MSSRMDPYGTSKPDFAALARKSAKLDSLAIKAHQDGRETYATIDFKDVKSSIALTEAILQHDFGVHCELREDRLCPPIPARLSYLKWVDEILTQTIAASRLIFDDAELDDLSDDVAIASRPAKRLKQDIPGPRIRIVDIGTGASCIYPILGCALAEEWEFLATDIDAISLEAAKKTIQDPRNNADTSTAPFTSGKQLRLKERIHLLLRRPDHSLFIEDDGVKEANLVSLPWPGIKGDLLYHAVMCNPPFYESVGDMQRSYEMKEEEPNAVCVGSANEMIYPGGEVEFIQRMIIESQNLGGRVLWYTSLIGLHRSLAKLAKSFKDAGITNVYFSALQSGATTRYAVAWSFTHFRLPLLATIHSAEVKATTQENAVLVRRIQKTMTEEEIGSLFSHLVQLLKERQVPCTKSHSTELFASACCKTWGRQGRRALKQGAAVAKSKEPIVSIKVVISSKGITAYWIYGRDRSLFFSFVDEILMTAINSHKT